MCRSYVWAKFEVSDGQGHEYPRQLEAYLNRNGSERYQVVNGAFPGERLEYTVATRLGASACRSSTRPTSSRLVPPTFSTRSILRTREVRAWRRSSLARSYRWKPSERKRAPWPAGESSSALFGRPSFFRENAFDIPVRDAILRSEPEVLSVGKDGRHYDETGRARYQVTTFVGMPPPVTAFDVPTVTA